MSFSYYERPHSPTRHPVTLLFLHGFTSTKESWVLVTRNLPKAWRIVVLDMPGHGESSFDPNLDYSPLGMAEKVHKVRAVLLSTIFQERFSEHEGAVAKQTRFVITTTVHPLPLPVPTCMAQVCSCTTSKSHTGHSYIYTYIHVFQLVTSM